MVTIMTVATSTPMAGSMRRHPHVPSPPVDDELDGIAPLGPEEPEDPLSLVRKDPRIDPVAQGDPAVSQSLLQEESVAVLSFAREEIVIDVPPRAQEEPETEVPPRAQEEPQTEGPPRAQEEPETEVPPRAQEEPETEVPPRAQEEPETEVPPRAQEEPETEVPPRAQEAPNVALPPPAREESTISGPPRQSSGRHSDLSPESMDVPRLAKRITVCPDVRRGLLLCAEMLILVGRGKR